MPEPEWWSWAHVLLEWGPKAKSWWDRKGHARNWRDARGLFFEWWTGLEPHSSFPREFEGLIAGISPELPRPDRWPTRTGGRWWDLVWEGPRGKVTVRFCRNREIRLLGLGTPTLVKSPRQVIFAVRVVKRR